VEALGERTDARVDVTLSRADGALEVAVADNGPGVPAASRDRIWDPDFTTKKGGTGLGLALVRQTIRAHGGEVELRGAGAAPGACFIVRLPLKRRTEGPG
jgi:signal transduction histidine kinase